MLRATLKSLLARKLRLVLSGMAVLLGVLFVSGSFVLTDTLTRSFDSLFENAFTGVDVQVSGAPQVAAQDGDRGGGGQPLPAALAGQLTSQVSGIAKATPVVSVEGVRVLGANRKVVSTLGPPRFGVDWPGIADSVRLREGAAPAADGEIALNAGLAKAGGLKVGDQVGVLTLEPLRTFKLVGIFEFSGGRDSRGGEQTVAFTTPVAQRLMLRSPDHYSAILVHAASGISDTTLRDRITAVVGTGYEVRTHTELTAAANANVQSGLSFFTNVLLGFAGVALFVGSFLILNTFSIIVAQRTRELALMRAMGASQRQMIGSVLLEALVIGVVASALGLLAGVGTGSGLAYLFSHLGGANLPLVGVGVPLQAVIAAFGVGITITLVAAALPALRAARVAPIAAMREAAAADRPLTRVTVSGAIVLAAGATLLGLGLAGTTGGATLWAILGGVLVSFIGVALLTPLISRPVVSLLGRLFSWSVPGQLGRRNSARNPRRTAITAAALMVGIALITGVNVILSSATTSITRVTDQQVKADLIISGEQTSRIPPTFDSGVLPKVRALPGVSGAVGFYQDFASVAGKADRVQAVDNPGALHDVFGLTAASGSLDRLVPGELLVDQKTAKDLGLHVSSTVPVQLNTGPARTFTLTGVYTDNNLIGGWLLAGPESTNFRSAQPSTAYLRVAPGTDVAGVRAQVDGLLADSPEVTVVDRSAFIKQQTSGFDTVLVMIQILLALAILIAVLGVVNTLALSVLERTRELGMLRAIGLRRAQTMRMVTVEAVVISMFGAVLGIAVGCGLGAAVVRALKNDGITDLAFPWSQLAVYLVLAAVVGVVAAILPAIRAARVNVLAAIAYE